MWVVANTLGWMSGLTKGGGVGKWVPAKLLKLVVIDDGWQGWNGGGMGMCQERSDASAIFISKMQSITD